MAKWFLHVEQDESQVWDRSCEAPSAEVAARGAARSLYPDFPASWFSWETPVLTVTDMMTGTVRCRITVQADD